MPDSLYETDWYAWTQEQAARLRDLPPSLRPNGLDVENLAEEVESMGASQRRAVESLLLRIYLHLLKIELHPAREAVRGWQKEIIAFRDQIAAELHDSPSLRARRQELESRAWRRALRQFEEELRLDAPERARVLARLALSDEAARYDLDTQVLEAGWYPEPYED